MEYYEPAIGFYQSNVDGKKAEAARLLSGKYNFAPSVPKANSTKLRDTVVKRSTGLLFPASYSNFCPHELGE